MSVMPPGCASCWRWLLRGFVPPPAIRQLRDSTRYRKRLIQAHGAECQRIQKTLEDAGVACWTRSPPTSWASGSGDAGGLGRRRARPQVLAELAKGKLRKKLPPAAPGASRFGEHHALLVGLALDHLEHLEGAIAALDGRIDEVIAPFAAARDRLDTITGVGKRAAEVIIAEIGVDMTVFPDRRAPGSEGSAFPATTSPGAQSLRKLPEDPLAGRRADRVRLGRCQKPRHLPGRSVLAAGSRIGKKKAAVAVGHSILVICWYLLDGDCDYHDLGGDFFIRRDSDRARKRAVAQLQALGYEVTLQPAPKRGDTRFRRALRRGASRTAEYRLQLTITAVARPVRRSVVRRVVLAAELSGVVARPDGGEGGPRPACGVQPSGSVSGIRLSSRLVSSPSGVRSPGVVVQGSGGPAVCVHPSSVQPSAVHSVRPDASVRLIPHQAGGVGGPSRGGGQPAHGNGARLWAAAPSGGSVDGQEAGRATLPRSRVGQWGVGGGSGPGWVGSGRCAEPVAAAALWAGEQATARGGRTRRVAAVLGWVCDHSAWSSPSLTAGWAGPEGPLEVPAGMRARPQRGPGAARHSGSLPTVALTCDDGWWACRT